MMQKLQQDRKGFSGFMAFVSNRMLFVYLGLALALFFLIDARTVAARKLNYWRDAAVDLGNFVQSRPVPSVQSVRTRITFLGSVFFYRSYITRSPDSLASYNDLAYALNCLGRSDAAARYLEVAYKKKPLVGIVYNLGLVRFQTGHFAEAVALFERIIGLSPQEMASELGTTRAIYGPIDEDKDPTGVLQRVYAHAVHCVVWGSLINGYFEKAELLSAKALTSLEGRDDYLLSAGLALCGQGRRDDGAGLVDRYLEKHASEWNSATVRMVRAACGPKGKAGSVRAAARRIVRERKPAGPEAMFFYVF